MAHRARGPLPQNVISTEFQEARQSFDIPLHTLAFLCLFSMLNNYKLFSETLYSIAILCHLLPWGSCNQRIRIHISSLTLSIPLYSKYCCTWFVNYSNHTNIPWIIVNSSNYELTSIYLFHPLNNMTSFHFMKPI